MNILDNSSAPINTDYVQTGTSNKLTTSEQQATHVFKKRLDFYLDSNNEAGEVVFGFALDSTINAELCKQYELYELEDVKLQFQSASPMGISSGSIQVGHITDPQNVAMPESKALALNKIIRQSNSCNIRPRDSTTLEIDTPGALWTLQAGDARLYSFGNVIAVVRTKPEVGDVLNFQVTLTGVLRASRTAVNMSEELPSRSRHTISKATVASIEGDGCTLRLTTNSNTPFSGSSIKFDALVLHCMCTFKSSKNELLNTFEIHSGRVVNRYYDDTTTAIDVSVIFPHDITSRFEINKVTPIMIKAFATVV